MKKIVLILLFSIGLLSFGANQSFAQQKEYKPIWALVGYGKSMNVDDSWGNGYISGPFKVTIGGAIWKYIAMELAIDTSWGNWRETHNGYLYKNSLWSLDLKPYFLVHQPIGTTDFAVIPYVGIAPVLGISGINHQSDYKSDDAEFQMGVAAKGGLRFQIFRFLNVGAGIEYTYHRNYKINGPGNRDMFTAIFEAGFMF